MVGSHWLTETLPAHVNQRLHTSFHDRIDHLPDKLVLVAAAVVQIPARREPQRLCLVDHALRVRKRNVALTRPPFGPVAPHGGAVGLVERLVVRVAVVPAAVQPDVVVAEVEQRRGNAAHRPAAVRHGVHRALHLRLVDDPPEGVERAPPEGRRQRQPIVERAGGAAQGRREGRREHHGDLSLSAIMHCAAVIQAPSCSAQVQV